MDCSPNPILSTLHNHIFPVVKHDNHENQPLPLCSFVIVIKYGLSQIIRFVVDMNYGCIPPMNWWGLAYNDPKRTALVVVAQKI